MISAELILDTRRSAKLGYPVKIRVYCSILQTHRPISAKIYQKGKTLKVNKEVAKKMTETEERVEYCNNLNLSLKDSLPIIKDGIPEDRDLEVYLLQKRIDDLRKNSGIGFVKFFDQYIEERQAKGQSVYAYEQARNQIVNFLGEGNDVRINNVDYEWLNSFVLYKKRTGKKRAGIPQYLTSMRAVYKEAQRRPSLAVKQDNPFLGLIKKPKRRKKLDYNIADIKRLFDFEPKAGTTKKSAYLMQRNIDIFLFQLAIGGHDYIELAHLKWSNIKDGRISFYRKKNDHREDGGEFIDNMLSEFAIGVIDKYGNKDNERVFSFIPIGARYKDFYRVVLKSLERISDTLGIAKLKTKSPRYIFNTFGGENKVDRLAIMQIQGHRPEGQSFDYQGMLSREFIDREHRKVLNLFF